jgi:TatD DNase family protein
MIDVHAHFAEEGYDFPSEWEKIISAGVTAVILAGDNVKHTAMHRDFCAAHEGAYFCAGVHPSETASFGEETLATLREFCAEKTCVAVGEIGLDYHYPEPEKSVQRAAFVKQILLAEEVGLPVQIHSRDSAADMLAILREMRPHLPNGFLLHCYSHGADMLPLFAELGGYFSFGGVACFKNAKNVWESVKACPRDRILTETDSPYLSPVRGEKNTPANIPAIAARLAELRGESLEEVVAAVGANARRLFTRLQ